MAPDKRQKAKTQTLSLRLDPKTRFVLEFVSRVLGQSITTVVERAIKHSADDVRIGGDFNEETRNWSDFWDPSEGVRTLKMLADDHYPTTYDEDELRQFTLAHSDFFYSDSRNKVPFRQYVDILWPQIESYLETWRDTKSSDYWAAGRDMITALEVAGVDRPVWPPGSSSGGSFGKEIDDEVPF